MRAVPLHVELHELSNLGLGALGEESLSRLLLGNSFPIFAKHVVKWWKSNH